MTDDVPGESMARPSSGASSGTHVMEAAQRLHPTSLLFSVVSAARNLLIPGLMVMFLSRDGGNWEMWLIPGLPAVPVPVA